MKQYKIVYELHKNEVLSNLNQKIIPSAYTNAIVRGYYDQIKGRVFLGKICNDSFEILTYSDNITLKNLFLFAAPAVMYGTIYELDHRTIVQYKIRKTYIAYVIAAFWGIIGGVWNIVDLLVLFMGNLDTQNGGGIFALSGGLISLIIAIMIIRIPHSEKEALHKLLEDLRTMD